MAPSVADHERNICACSELDFVFPLPKNVGGATSNSKITPVDVIIKKSGKFPKVNRFSQFHDIHDQVDDESATGANCICRDALEYVQRG